MRIRWNLFGWSALMLASVLLFAACGNQSTPSTNGTAETETPKADTAAKPAESATQSTPDKPAEGATQVAAGDAELAAKGRLVFLKNGCNTCHMAGDNQLGPSLYGLYGTEVKLKDGSTVIADEAYIRESILEPNKKLVAGYSPVMVAYKLPEEELNQLVAYIKSLKDQKPEGK